MKIWLMFILLLVPFSFAIEVNEVIYSTNDTFTSMTNGNPGYCQVMNIGSYSGTLNLSDNLNYGNLTEVLYTLCCQTSGSSWAYVDTRAFLKFSTDSINKIITDVRLNTGNTTRFNFGSYVYNNLYYSRNITWDEHDITRLNEPEITAKIYQNNLFNFSDFQTNNIIEVSNAQFVRGNVGTIDFVRMLYEEPYVTLVIRGSETTGVSCGAFQVGNQFTSASRDSLRGDYPPFLNVTMADYVSGFMNISWGGWGDDNFYFDFETETASSGQRSQDDFRLTRSGSITVPPNSVFVLQDVKSGVYNSYDYSSENNLIFTDCKNVVYSNGQISNINTPLGTRWTICFNLSSEHQGKNYYGAIKVIDNTNAYTSFYYAIYSPDFTTFSELTINPENARHGDNILVSYTTTNPLTSGIIVNGVVDDVAVPTMIFKNESELRTSHSLIIPNITGGYFNATYCVKPYGTDAHDNTYVGNDTCFNVSSHDSYIISRNNAFENFTDAFIILPKDSKTKATLYATCSLYDSPCNLPLCDVTPEPCIVRNTTTPPCSSGQAECWRYCPLGLSSCDYSSTIHNCNNNYFVVESSPLSQSPRLFYNGTFVNTHYISVHVGTSNMFDFYPFYWNYTCNVDGYVQKKGYFYVYSPLPYYVDILFDKNPSCFATYRGLTSQYECEINMNLSHPNAWYCTYDASYCMMRNSLNECVKYGAWTGYECDSCEALPLGYSCNASVPVGIMPNGTVSGGQERFFNVLATIFAINVDSAKAMLSLLFVIIVTAMIGIRTRDGLITAIMFLGMLTLFMFLGWLPLWILVIQAVLVAFLVANFFKRISTGG